MTQITSRTTYHPVFGQFREPFGPEDIADICGVDLRTAQRWWSRESCPPRSAVRLVQLTLRGRIMPDSWPGCWRFSGGVLCSADGTKLVSWQDVESYQWVSQSWYEAMRLIVATERRIEALLAHLPDEACAKLEQHRERLTELRTRDHIAQRWRLRKRETHRRHGC